MDGGNEAFVGISEAIEYMNANPETTSDANCFYNACYVARYEETGAAWKGQRIKNGANIYSDKTHVRLIIGKKKEYFDKVLAEGQGIRYI